MKRITQLENDMNKVQADLTISSEKLEKANKKNSDVSYRICFLDLKFDLKTTIDLIFMLNIDRSRRRRIAKESTRARREHGQDRGASHTRHPKAKRGHANGRRKWTVRGESLLLIIETRVNDCITTKSVRKSLEARNVSDIERIAQLEKAIKESQFIAEESERRFDETNKKVEVFESDLERTYERADSGEA